MSNRLLWKDLTEKEKEQAENSYLSILEDIATSGDEYDKADYECKRDDRGLRLRGVQTKSFIRDDDGYIFVNM
jgi:hypothetical protein